METENPKVLDASVVEQVLSEIAQERKDAHDALVKAEKAMTDQIDAINEDSRAIIVDLNDALANLKAHQRFKGRLPQQTFDAMSREFEKARDSAQAAHTKASKDAQERIAPFQAVIKAHADKCRELAVEWNGHVRIAKAAGVDLTAFWTPEAPLQVA